MPKYLLPVTLQDSRTNNRVYTFYIDQDLVLSNANAEGQAASIQLEMKKIGLALQRLAKQYPRLTTAPVYVRYVHTQTDAATGTPLTYDFVIEQQNKIEIYPHVLIPGYELAPSTGRKPSHIRTLYLKEEKNGLAYQVKNAEGNQYGTIPWAKLPSVPQNVAAICANPAEYLPLIQSHTTDARHTATHIDFDKIQSIKTSAAVVELADLNMDSIIEGMQKNLFTRTENPMPLRLQLLPRRAELTEENDISTLGLTEPQRQTALQLCNGMPAILKIVEEQAHRSEQAREQLQLLRQTVTVVTNTMQLQMAAAPLESEKHWNEATHLAIALQQEISGRELALTKENERLQAMSARAENLLLTSYENAQSHATKVVKPIVNATIHLLQAVILEYFTTLMNAYPTGLSETKLQELIAKCDGVANITFYDPYQEAAMTTKPSLNYCLSFDETLLRADLDRLQTIIHSFLTNCQKYQQYFSATPEFNDLEARLYSTPILRGRFSFTSKTFQWHDISSHIALQATRETAALREDANAFVSYFDTALGSIPLTQMKIKQLQATAEIVPTMAQPEEADLTKLKLTAERATKRIQRHADELAAQLNKCMSYQASMDNILKSRAVADYSALQELVTHLKSTDLSTTIAKGFNRAKTSLDKLPELIAAVAQSTHAIHNCRSIAEATTLRATQDEQIQTFLDTYKQAAAQVNAMETIKNTLDNVEATAVENARLAEIQRVKAAEAAERAQQLAEAQRTAAEMERAAIAARELAEQQQRLQAAAAQEELNRRDLRRQHQVTDIAKKIIHILSAVTHWHNQVRLWGGIKVTHPDGGQSTVPTGVAEMIAIKRTVNVSDLSYADAERFLTALKEVAARAKQRGSWNCCYPVRKQTTTHQLYCFINDLDVQQPPQNCGQDFNNIYPGWEKTYNAAAAVVVANPEVSAPAATPISVRLSR